MNTALADEDIQPAAILDARAEGHLAVTRGVEGTEAALVDALTGVDALFATSRLPLTASVFERTGDLRVVGKIGTGIDSVDCEAAAAAGVTVTYTPGLNATAVAEYTVGLVIAVSRGLLAARDHLRAGGWRDDVAHGTQVSGKTVGIVGFGDVGRRIAGMLAGFTVDVLAYDPYVYPEDAELTGTELTDLDDLLARSDIVTVNAELTDETRGLIGHRELARMKESAFLVNTARGPIVDETALVDALDSESIAGAALDVFEIEPLPADSPLHDFENVVATPHVAALTRETRQKSIETLVDNVTALLDGGPVPDRYIAADAR